MSAVIVSIAGGQASGKKTVLAALERRLLELSGNRLSIATLHMSGFQRSAHNRRTTASTVTTPLLTSQTDGSVSLINTPDAAIQTPTDSNKDINEALAEEDDEGIHAFDLDSMASAAELVVSGDLDPSEVGGGLSQSRGRLNSTTTNTNSGSGKNTPRGAAGGGGVDVLLMEGHYLLCHKRLLEMANIKVFVDLDADVRLGWRVLRDTEENHLALDTVFDHYVRFGKRAFEETIYPTKPLADIILPRGPETAAIDLIAMGVWDDIRARKDEQVRLLKQGIAALQVVGGVGGVSGVGIGGGPGHFSPLRSYSPTRPYVSKNRITIGEADLENFYGNVS